MRWLGGIINSIDMHLSSLGDSEGPGSLACYSPWGRKESDMTEQLNNNNVHLLLTEISPTFSWLMMTSDSEY